MFTTEGAAEGMFYKDVRPHSPECVASRSAMISTGSSKRSRPPHAFVEAIVRGKFQSGEQNAARIAGLVSGETGIFITAGQVRGVLRKLRSRNSALGEFQQFPAFADAARAVGHRVEYYRDENSGEITKIAVVFCGASHFARSTGFTSVVCLDGAHMSAPGCGMLLSAVTLTGCRTVQPLAVAWAPEETKEAYMFLLEAIQKSEITCDVFISDKAKGLTTAIPAVFPRSISVPCVYHAAGNIKNSDARSLFWRVIKAGTQEQFTELLETMRTEFPATYEQQLATIEMHYPFSGKAVFTAGSLTSNAVESWNSAMKKAGARNVGPVRAVQRAIALGRQYAIATYSECGARRGQLPTGDAAIAEARRLELSSRVEPEEGSSWEMTLTVKVIVDVFDRTATTSTSIYIVTLSDWTCSCRQRIRTRLPCVHAIRVGFDARVNVNFEHMLLPPFAQAPDLRRGWTRFKRARFRRALSLLIRPSRFQSRRSRRVERRRSDFRAELSDEREHAATAAGTGTARRGVLRMRKQRRYIAQRCVRRATLEH
jgi:hypothetical protein